ncbi:MAG: glycosyltransferase [Herpetosiphon sp.]
MSQTKRRGIGAAQHPWLHLALPQTALVARQPHRRCELCVIIPARDEAQYITNTLRSLFDQRDVDGTAFDRRRFEVIVLANNCSDETAMLVRSFAAAHPDLALHLVEKTLPPTMAVIGHARGILMDEAYRRFAYLGRPRGIIASTDADTVAAPTWVASIVSEMARGVDVVAGRIVTDSCDRAALNPATRAYHLKDVGYRHLIAELEGLLDGVPWDRWPRHHQHFGANLALTAEIYGRAGGVPRLHTLEDVALYEKLGRVDARIRHSPAVRVTTSARCFGRTEIGLASQIKLWNDMGIVRDKYLVESAQAAEHRFTTRRTLRGIWQQGLHRTPAWNSIAAAVAEACGVSVPWLTQTIGQARSFGDLAYVISYYQRNSDAWRERWPLVPVETAIADLRVRLAVLRATLAQPLYSLEEIHTVRVKTLAVKVS